MVLELAFSIIFGIVSHQIALPAPRHISKSITLRATGYYPGGYRSKREAKREGGAHDRYGNRLRPLQLHDELVSVATDPRVIPSGTLLVIDEYPGKLFLACDVGKAIKGKRIDICVTNRKNSYKIPKYVTARIRRV